MDNSFLFFFRKSDNFFTKQVISELLTPEELIYIILETNFQSLIFT